MTTRYLPRPEAAKYISNRLGRRVSTGALHRHASDGTGPKYVMILGRASYTETWLDDWIDQLMRAPAPRRRADRHAGYEYTGPSASAA